MKMKKLYLGLTSVALVLALAACGEDEATKTEDTNTQAEQTATKTETKDVTNMTMAEKMALLQEPDENTKCEMCNMKVYEKTDEMGKFSAQAIKADGSNSFYDDIGCLLNAEIKNNEKNDKFVRDFNTLEWILVDDATIVKTDLKTPMNWGYAFFKLEEDANKYIEEHDGAYIEKLDTIKAAAKKRMEEKMKKQQEQQKEGNGNMNNMDHNNMEMEDNMDMEGHDHN